MADDEELENEILAEIFAALDAGRDPELGELLERFPCHAATVERLHRAARRYWSTTRGSAGPERLPPGTRLGDFEIVDLVALGGMGAVYRARQISLGGREVALKVLPGGVPQGERGVRFRREALALARLHHPRLAEVHGFFEADGHAFYAMRLVLGPTLADVLARRADLERPPLDRATQRRLVGWTADVASALVSVHEASLVHRDVKPGNVVIEDGTEGDELPQGFAVLIDFGLVRPVQPGEPPLTGTLQATFPYAPIEQVLGREVDARADVFALGVTLHDLLVGRLPEERAPATAGLEPLRALRPEVDEDLAAVVGKAVDPDARWRYADAAALLADLDAWLAGRPVSARRLAWLERGWRWLVEHEQRLMRASGLVGLFLLCAFVCVTVGRVVELSRRVQAALASGEAPRVAVVLGDVPAWLARLVLRDDVLVEMARRLRAPGPGDPMTDVASRLVVDDVFGGLLAAARPLRRDGIGSDPVLERLLVMVLASPEGQPAEDRRAALQVTAALFYERPDDCPASAAASAPFRSVLRGLWTRSDLTGEERLLLLTALSGCGEAEDAGAILDWALGWPAGHEERRLGVQCAEHIVRRAHACGSLSRLDTEQLWEKLAPELRPCLEDESACLLARPALMGLAEALAFAARAAGQRPDEQLLLGCADGFDLRRPDRQDLRLLAALGSEHLQSWLGDAELVGLDQPGAWGWICGALDDAALGARLRQACAAQCEPIGPYSPAVVAFDASRRESEDARAGRRDAYLLDSDTLLGADPGMPALETLRAEVEEPGAGAAAAWDFRAEVPSRSGCALDPEVSFVRPGFDGQHYLRLGVFGNSEVRLHLGLCEESAGRAPGDPWRVVLRHQSAVRTYYPYQGRAFIEVRLDGEPVGSILANEFSERETVVEIPASRFMPGSHVISVRLLRESQTTWRLMAVRVERP